MASGLFKWFTPSVASEDSFVPPDFSLGQFFYSAATARQLVDLFDSFRNPCCLCTPRLAHEWHRRGRTVRLLDYDRRFASMPGFRPFDLMRPTSPDEEFDLIIFDPIFAEAKVLRRGLDIVAGIQNGKKRPSLYMTFPVEREAELIAEFGDWKLSGLELPLLYNNVRREHAGLFRLYGNRPLPSPAG